MSIILTPFEHGALCSTRTVEDEDVLADQIARIALGQSRHDCGVVTDNKKDFDGVQIINPLCSSRSQEVGR
ncbi:hypothetical protein [Bradyrhizobium sp. RT9a]|uniref:hypothetical protein n=1 Tax=Bradyrhizobium sp. RT9a TaxID=3156384 RepID=UPI0033930A64